MKAQLFIPNSKLSQKFLRSILLSRCLLKVCKIYSLICHIVGLYPVGWIPTSWFIIAVHGLVWGMSLRKVTSLGSKLASVTDLKRIQTPHSLCCGFGGYKTFTTR